MADRRAGPNDGLRVLKKQEDYEQWVYEIKLFVEEKDVSAASIPDLMEELEDEEDDRTMLSPLERVKDVRKCCAIQKDVYEEWSGVLSARERKSRTTMLRRISRSIGRDYTHLVRDGVADPCLVLARIMNFFEDTEEEDAEELHEDFLGLRIGQFESATKFCSKVKSMAKKLNALGKTITPTALKLALVRGLKEEPQFEKFYDYVRHAYKTKTIEKLVRDIVKEARLKGSDSIDMTMGEPEKKKKGSGKPSGQNWVSKVRCWKCGKLGHFKRNCPKGKNERTKEGGAENVDEAASDSEDSFVWSMAEAKIENPVWLLASMNGLFAVLLATTFVVTASTFGCFRASCIVATALLVRCDVLGRHTQEFLGVLVEAVKGAQEHLAQLTSKNGKTVFCVDSGASRSHVTSSKLLTGVENMSPRVISFANGERNRSSKKGTLRFKKGSEIVEIEGVYVSPYLKRNYLSVAHMLDAGIKTYFEPDHCVLKKRGVVIAMGRREKGLYTVEMQTCRDGKRCEQVGALEKSVPTWKSRPLTMDEAHLRFGHKNPADIIRTARVVEGLMLKKRSLSMTRKCGTCALAKIRKKGHARRKEVKTPRKRMPKLKSTEKQSVDHLDRFRRGKPGEAFGSDLKGPIKPGRHGYCHWMGFLCLATNFLFGYWLKSKADAGKAFRRLHELVKNQWGRKVKTLVCDGGGEFKGVYKGCEPYCKDNGIDFRPSTEATPQQNGRSEIINWVIFNMAKAMILTAEMPKSMAFFAVKHATRVWNVTVHKGSEVTPHERWHGSKPHVGHLITFGSCGVAYVSKANREAGGLANKGELVRYLGPDDRGDGFTVVKEGGAVVTRDTVQWHENVFKCRSVRRSIERDENDEKHDDNSSNTDVEDDDDEQEERGGEEQRKSARSKKGVPPLRMGVHDEAHSIASDAIVIMGREEVGSMQEEFVEAAREAMKLEGRGPFTYNQVMKSDEREEWENEVRDELDNYCEMGVWTPVERTADMHVIPSTWAMQKKFDASHKLKRRRARLAMRGDRQREGIDYKETFAPTCRFETLRLIMYMAVSLGCDVTSVDFHKAFLNGPVEEVIYVSLPQGFVFSRKLKGLTRWKHVLKLLKAAYGTCQAARQWFKCVRQLMLDLGFTQATSDQCLFVRFNPLFIVLVWVDDLLCMCPNSKVRDETVKQMEKVYRLRDEGPVDCFLNVQFEIKGDELTMTQEHYIESMLKRFGMEECNAVKIPMAPNPDMKVEGDKSG